MPNCKTVTLNRNRKTPVIAEGFTGYLTSTGYTCQRCCESTGVITVWVDNEPYCSKCAEKESMK